MVSRHILSKTKVQPHSLKQYTETRHLRAHRNRVSFRPIISSQAKMIQNRRPKFIQIDSVNRFQGMPPSMITIKIRTTALNSQIRSPRVKHDIHTTTNSPLPARLIINRIHISRIPRRPPNPRLPQRIRILSRRAHHSRPRSIIRPTFNRRLARTNIRMKVPNTTLNPNLMLHNNSQVLRINVLRLHIRAFIRTNPRHL